MQNGTVFQNKWQSQTSKVSLANTQPRLEGGFLNLIPMHIPSEKHCPSSLEAMATTFQNLPGKQHYLSLPWHIPIQEYVLESTHTSLEVVKNSSKLVKGVHWNFFPHCPIQLPFGQLQEVLAGMKRQAKLLERFVQVPRHPGIRLMSNRGICGLCSFARQEGSAMA